MNPVDAKMLEAAETLKSSGRMKSQREFFDLIGFHYQNVYNIRTGYQSFKTEHIARACVLAGINANWIFGAEEKMFRAVNSGNSLATLPEKRTKIPSRKPNKKLKTNAKKRTVQRVSHS